MNLKFFFTLALLLCGSIALNAQSESEPNNTTSTANVVALGDCISADLNSRDDIDYFKVTAPKGGVIQIKMVNVPSTVRLEVDFYNSGGSTIVSSTAYKKGLEIFMEAIVPAGDYFLRVNDYYNGVSPEGSFSICFSFDGEDDFEFNNSFAQAATVPFDSCFSAKLWGSNYTSPNSVYRDRDYFKFSITNGGVVNFSITDVPLKFVLLLKIYDKDLNFITDWKGDFGRDIDFNAILKAGDYFFSITEFNDRLDSNAFKMCLSFDGSDAWEYNNSAVLATQVAPDTCFKGRIKGFETLGSSRISDRDIFKFRLNKGGMFSVNASSVPSNIEMIIFVYDSALNLVESVTGHEGLPVSLNKHLCEGLYYVLLGDRNFYVDSDEEYSVCFDLKEDEDCYKGFANAFRVNVCDTASASFQKIGDEDFFRFWGTGKDIRVRVMDVPSSVKVKLSLFDNATAPIGSPVLGDANGDEVMFSIPSSSLGDVYYATVEAESGFSVNNYGFEVLDEGCMPLPPPPVSVDEFADANAISVYPNPSSGEFFITIPAGEVSKISISNILGQVVYSNNFYSGEAINLDAESGIYLIRIKTKEGIYQRRFLLQNE